MGNSHVAKLRENFEANRHEENAVHMQRYMRDQFPFIGLKAKERRELAREFMKEAPFHDESMPAMIKELWALPEREYQNVAVDYLVKFKRHLTLDHVDLIEFMITTKSWWDTVDAIASHLVGTLFAKYPALIEGRGNKWLTSNNIWLQRSMILFQLKYKKETDQALLFSTINQLKGIDEFFIQKAIGWALREYSKTNPQAVGEFIQTNELSKLAVREGSKYVNIDQ